MSSVSLKIEEFVVTLKMVKSGKGDKQEEKRIKRSIERGTGG